VSHIEANFARGESTFLPQISADERRSAVIRVDPRLVSLTEQLLQKDFLCATV
jgi:hypothetical protein